MVRNKLKVDEAACLPRFREQRPRWTRSGAEVSGQIALRKRARRRRRRPPPFYFPEISTANLEDDRS